MEAAQTPITRVIAKFGSVKAFADKLGVQPQAISQWGEIPVKRVLAIEKLTGIPRHELRPDLWEVPHSANVSTPADAAAQVGV